MSRHLLKELPELVNSGVISQEVADSIRSYYEKKNPSSLNRMMIAFGILGAILVGLGIILIIAHNWDELPRTTKTALAFLPLLIGQAACAFTIIKQRNSTAWVEGSSAFLFFAVGACISLISQIYNIPGNLTSFLFTWMLLCMPLIYVMNSSITSLLYIIGITYYACESGYWSHPANGPLWYWLFLLLCLPHFFRLHRNQPESNFMTFHSWLVPLSVLIALGTVAKNKEELMFVAYFSLLGFFYQLGSSNFFREQKRKSNGFFLSGALGTIGLLLALSFDSFWKMLGRQKSFSHELLTAPEFLVTIVVTVIAAIALLLNRMNSSGKEAKPLSYVFIVFIPLFILGFDNYALPQIIVNLLILGLGAFTIRQGAQENHLGILNFGLLILTTLITCRYFDSDLSFIAKGILFVCVGLGFFFSNYMMLKKRRQHE